MKQKDRLNAIENKTVVLTGASSGIGLEVLRQLAWGKGNRILAVARHVDNLNGFQQAIRLEKPDNLQLTCLFPVATDTNFFRVANPVEFEKPFPVQKPDHVAKKMIAGIEDGKARVSPSGLFGFAKVLMGVAPPVRTAYWKLETAKLERFKEKLERYHGALHENMKTVAESMRVAAAENMKVAAEKGRELGETLREKEQDVRKELGEKTAQLRGEIRDRHGL